MEYIIQYIYATHSYKISTTFKAYPMTASDNLTFVFPKIFFVQHNRFLVYKWKLDEKHLVKLRWVVKTEKDFQPLRHLVYWASYQVTGVAFCMVAPSPKYAVVLSITWHKSNNNWIRKDDQNHQCYKIKI